jgi:nucleotide-binding universal stress UspA family protein
MLEIGKILLPVDFPNTSLRVIHQAAALARHFHAEIVMLHVITPQSRAAGVPDGGPALAAWDMLAAVIKAAEKSEDRSLARELAGLHIQRILVRGDAAHAIVQMAQKEKADLIIMPSHGSAFCQFLLGSVTAKVLHESACPVWTGAHVEDASLQELAIRNVLCAVDVNTYDRKTVSWAARMAAEFNARLALAHVTDGVEFWGPGGDYVNVKWKDSLVSNASEHIAALQRTAGTKAEVFIASGNVASGLCKAVSDAKADLLVTGCYPYGGRLRTHGYATICAVPIPVLSV